MTFLLDNNFVSELRKPRAHRAVVAWIAATARVLSLTVATRSIKHFEPFNVPVFNPFTHPRKEKS